MTDKYAGLDLQDIYDRLTAIYPKTVEPIKRFRNQDDARAAVNTALQLTRDNVIRVLQPDYKKTRRSGQLWALYRDGMLVSEFFKMCIAMGFLRGELVKDIHYNNQKGLISLV